MWNTDKSHDIVMYYGRNFTDYQRVKVESTGENSTRSTQIYTEQNKLHSLHK